MNRDTLIFRKRSDQRDVYRMHSDRNPKPMYQLLFCLYYKIPRSTQLVEERAYFNLWPQREKGPSWQEGFTVSGRHGGETRKQKDHTFSAKPKEQKTGNVVGFKLSKSRQGCASSTRIHLPTASQKLETKCSNTQACGTISHSNHHMASGSKAAIYNCKTRKAGVACGSQCS